MQSSQGRTTSGRTFRIQLDVPRAVVVVLLLASLVEVRSLMPCSNASDCNYEGCNNDATPLPLSPTTCGYHQSLQNSFCYFYYGTCPERPCPAGTFNSVSSCVSGGDGYGGRIVGRGGGTECSCTACPAGRSDQCDRCDRSDQCDRLCPLRRRHVLACRSVSVRGT